MAQQPDCPSEGKRTPQVRVPQDDNGEPSFRLVAAMILLAILLGVILILGANVGESIQSQHEIRTAVAPPHMLPLVDNQSILNGGNLTATRLALDYAAGVGYDNLVFPTKPKLPTGRTLEPVGPVMSREMPGIRRGRITD